MGIYVKNNNKVSDILIDVGGEKKNVVSAWTAKNGIPAIIFRKQANHSNTWADGTWEEISAMLERHYAGEINIADYWNIGDERVISMSAIPTWNSTYGEAQPAQNITLVIIGFNLDTLSTPVNGISKAAITVHLKQCLSNPGVIDADFIDRESKYNSFNLDWELCDRRGWCGRSFINSLPSELQNLTKGVLKTCRKIELSGSSSNETWYVSSNNISSPTVAFHRAFFLDKYELGLASGKSDKDKIVYPYYQIKDNLNKKIIWWLRDPYSKYLSGPPSSFGWEDCTGYNFGAQFLSNKAGIAPAFCL